MKKKPITKWHRKAVIVMVHGLNDTGEKFKTMADYLENEGYQTHALTLPHSFGMVDLTVLAQQVKDYIDRNFANDELINLIGFSMGGVITRYYLQRLNGLSKVHKYVNISAPNNGTVLGYLLPFKGIQQMRPDSDFLKDLNQDVKQQLSQIPSLIIWTPVDTMIIPPQSSLIDVGQELLIPLQIHRSMVKDKKVLSAISQFFNEDEKS